MLVVGYLKVRLVAKQALLLVMLVRLLANHVARLASRLVVRRRFREELDLIMDCLATAVVLAPPARLFALVGQALIRSPWRRIQCCCRRGEPRMPGPLPSLVEGYWLAIRPGFLQGLIRLGSMVFLLSLLVQVLRLVHLLLLAPGFRAILSFILIAKLVLALQSEGPQVSRVQEPPQEPVCLELLVLQLKALGLQQLLLKLARPLAFQLRALLSPPGIQELLGPLALPLSLLLLGLKAMLLPIPLAVRQSMVPMAQRLLLQLVKSALLPPALSHPHQQPSQFQSLHPSLLLPYPSHHTLPPDPSPQQPHTALSALNPHSTLSKASSSQLPLHLPLALSSQYLN